MKSNFESKVDAKVGRVKRENLLALYDHYLINAFEDVTAYSCVSTASKQVRIVVKNTSGYKITARVAVYALKKRSSRQQYAIIIPPDYDAVINVANRILDNTDQADNNEPLTTMVTLTIDDDKLSKIDFVPVEVYLTDNKEVLDIPLPFAEIE